MQFEKVFISNNNGVIDGYHKKGKYENGKVDYELNEKINNDNVKEHSFGTNALSFDNALAWDPFNWFLPSRHLCRPQRLAVGHSPSHCQPCPDADAVKLSDDEFISHCETKLAPPTIEDEARKLKHKLRRALERRIHPEGLTDFKRVVELLKQDSLSDDDKHVLELLVDKYSNLQ